MDLNRRGVLIGLSATLPILPAVATAAAPAPLWGVVATADGPWRSRVIHLDAEAAAVAKPPRLRRTFVALPCEAYVQSIG